MKGLVKFIRVFPLWSLLIATPLMTIEYCCFQSIHTPLWLVVVVSYWVLTIWAIIDLLIQRRKQ